VRKCTRYIHYTKPQLLLLSLSLSIRTSPSMLPTISLDSIPITTLISDSLTHIGPSKPSKLNNEHFWGEAYMTTKYPKNNPALPGACVWVECWLAGWLASWLTDGRAHAMR
jgi:hypothetical protein